jgi:hypothetical protein
MKEALTLVLVGLMTGGCRDRSSARPALNAAPAPATTALGSSFRHDILPVLLRTCAQAKGCHGEKPTDSVDLDLRAAAAYGQLVNHAAKARKGALRVKPGDPAASFLIDKLTDSLGPQEGKSMPLDPDTGAPIDPSPVPAAFIEDALKPWILAGAPDN